MQRWRKTITGKCEKDRKKERKQDKMGRGRLYKREMCKRERERKEEMEH